MTDIKVGMYVTRNRKASLWDWWESRCQIADKSPAGPHKVIFSNKDGVRLEGFGYIGFDKANFKIAYDPLLQAKELEDYL